MVGNGVIHSTDDVIESLGDYREFFNNMITNNDFKPLSKAHNLNFQNAISSMKNGITPVIIDNTNIKHNEAKNYVEAALSLGYSDDNIRFVDIGTGGLSSEALADRNTHGVPHDKIKSMIQSYESCGPIGLEEVLKSKSMYKTSDVLYSAVVLDTASKNTLMDKVDFNVPDGWKIIAHHMTITMGPLKDKTDLGKEVTLLVTKLGKSDMAIAVEVEGYTTKNKIPHVTIAVNPYGGKPAMSNLITNWQDIKTFYITGIVTEIKS